MDPKSDSRESASANPRREAPPRPSFSSGLPTPEEIPTPRTVRAVIWIVILAALCFIVFTALSVPHLAEIRQWSEKQLEDQSSDYSKAEIAKAVKASLAVVVGAGLLLVLGELLCVRNLMRGSWGARTVLVVLIVLEIPVLIVTQALRGVGDMSPLGTILQACSLLLVVVLLALPKTSRWLAATH